MNVRNDDFTPVATFDYHPNSYEDWLKQKFQMIQKNKLWDTITAQKQLDHLQYQDNDFQNYKSHLTRKPSIELESEDYDFKPYFPNYNSFNFADAKSEPVVKYLEPSKALQRDLTNQKPSILPVKNSLESWDKFLDTKTVVAGVDIVKINPESY